MAGDDISRRTFNQILGAAAIGAALPNVSVAATASSPPMAEDLCNHAAGDLASLIRQRKASAREVVAVHLARIERVNPSVNAVITLVADRALADATRADDAIARGDRVGPLHGEIVAPHRGDWNLLRLAYAFEQATKFGQTRPKLVTG
jgi:Asp-tRNA(Asn)/Glu-tRNA(Gln) amidotransferase A subunit family amidase